MSNCECEDIIIELSEEGQDGNGIASIVLLSTVGLVKAYRINYTNGSHFDYTVEDGNGIVSVTKLGSTDNVDHYRILFDNGDYFDYDVANVDTSEFYTKTETDTLLSAKADADSVYSKSDTDDLLDAKADKSSVYTKTQADELLDLKADKADVYTQEELNTIFDGIDNALSTKADKDSTYTKTQTDNLLASKANAADVYSKSAVDSALSGKANTADLGALAGKDTVDYETEVTNKPTLGTMSAENATDYYDKTATDALLLDKAPVILNTASGAIASFSDGSPAPVTTLTVGIEPVQAGTGDPSPDNVRPISGFSQAKVTRTGKNLFNWSAVTSAQFSISNGVFTNTQTDTRPNLQMSLQAYNGSSYTNLASALSVISTGRYSITVSSVPKDMTTLRIKHNGITKDLILFSISYWTKAVPFTVSFTVVSNDPTTVGGLVISDIQIELGSTVTDYVPYQPIQQVTIDLGETRYGGTLDVLTGTMTVTHRYLVADGVNVKVNGAYGNAGPDWLPTIKLEGANLSPSGDAFRTAVITSYLETTLNIISTENTVMLNKNGQGIVLHIGTMQGTDGTHGYNSGTEVQNAVNTYLQSNNLQICYELAQPVTIQLSANTLSPLKGQNNIWADTGDVEVEYRADTKLYVDGKLAEAVAELQALILEN